MSNLVGNPEDRVSVVAAQIGLKMKPFDIKVLLCNIKSFKITFNWLVFKSKD